MNAGQSPLERALAGITIADLGARFFPSWRPGRSCCSPFREDRHPSFSVFDNGRAWKDHATGEHGDAVDFLAKACGITLPEACRELIDLAGVGGSTLPRPSIASPRPTEAPARSACAETTGKPALPADLAAPTADELDALAKLRHLPDTCGLVAAVAAGHLRAGTFRGVRVWIVTDSTRCSAQARRMDGATWRELNGSKAWNLRGSAASWPIGAADIGERPRVLVAEGGGDFLCLWHLIAAADATDCAPVGILGSTQSIHSDAARFFRGKDITIYPHADAAGQRGRDAWARQFYAAGAKAVRSFNLAARLNGRGKDLNDLLALDAAEAPVPDRLCPACWSRRIAAPMGGPTCSCNPYVWPTFTADQLANDFRR